MSDSKRIVSILGGYGIFGGRVAQALALDGNCRVRVIGRRARIGCNFAHRIGAEFRECKEIAGGALRREIDGSFLVIHAAGPFQGAGYDVAELCIEMGAHYLDLADAREYVAGIGVLDAAARGRDLMVASGVSTTPAITSALIDALVPEFSRIESIQTALSPGNQNPRGEATIAAVLSYLGRTIRVWQDGKWVERAGWGDVMRLTFPPPVGRRRVHNCEGPELELFPVHYQARTVRFSAGLELNVLNYLLSFSSFAARWLKIDFTRRARFFLNASLTLFPLGTTNGALSICLKGQDSEGRPIERRIALVTDTDGPATPCSAAIILARKLLRNGPSRLGAFPCIGLLSLEELVEHLEPLGVWCARGDENRWGPRDATGTSFSGYAGLGERTAQPGPGPIEVGCTGAKMRPPVTPPSSRGSNL